MFKLELFAYSLHMLCYCYHALDFSTENESKFASCEKYFQGKPWPQPKDSDSPVNLCQTQLENDSSSTKQMSANPIVFYATLFDTYRRTPLYSANRVKLSSKNHNDDRPSSTLFKRVAIGLCRNTIPQTAIYSNIAFVDNHKLEKCKNLQAVVDDYRKNNMELDRGHLSPSHINGPNKAKQDSTFTLTNVAPQYANFNRFSWRLYEKYTESYIRIHAPEEYVYIITGVFGSAFNEIGEEIWLYGNTPNKRVKVPGYYWKAVCYPGNKQRNKKPWGFAFIEKNINVKVKPSFESLISLKEFKQKYFKDPPFGSECMNTNLTDVKSQFFYRFEFTAFETEPWWQQKEEL